MADKNRSVGGDDAFDEDALDDDALEADDEAPAKSGGRRGEAAAAGTAARTRDKDEKRGFIRNIPYFIREIFAELQKVIWPTRRELLTYASVVVIFVTIVMTVVSLLDVGFAKALLWVFGGTATE